MKNTTAIIEERSQTVGPRLHGGQRETITTYWAAYGGNATQLKATTREAAEIELEERRIELEERWGAHARGMAGYADRFGTAGE